MPPCYHLDLCWAILMFLMAVSIVDEMLSYDQMLCYLPGDF